MLFSYRDKPPTAPGDARLIPVMELLISDAAYMGQEDAIGAYGKSIGVNLADDMRTASEENIVAVGESVLEQTRELPWVGTRAEEILWGAMKDGIKQYREGAQGVEAA
jgi:hypothetical protein